MHNLHYTLLGIESTLQSLDYDTPGPRPCLVSFSCWSVLTKHARMLNQYTYVSTVHITVKDRIDTRQRSYNPILSLCSCLFIVTFRKFSSLYTAPFPLTIQNMSNYLLSHTQQQYMLHLSK